MSELFEDEPRDLPPQRPGSRRSRVLVVAAMLVVLGFFLLTTFAGFYTDRLWFVDIGFASVFSTLLVTRIGLFAVFGLLMAAIVVGNMAIAYRLRPLFGPANDNTGLDRYRDAVTPIRLWLMIGVGALLVVFAGASGAGQWRNYLLWRNQVPFERNDPYFDRDIGFYVFQLPWLHYLVDFAMAASIVALLAAGLVHYLYGGIRLQDPGNRLSGGAQGQLSVLLGVFVAAKGIDYYLDRFDLVHDGSGLITGLTYTDDHAVLPAKNILMGIAAICAVLFFLNVWRRTWLLPTMGLALMALSAVLLGMIWPGIVQQFQVRPSEPDRERPYIEKNIASTREAYDLEAVEEQSFENNSQADGSEEERQSKFTALSSVLSSVPLVDPVLVQETFEQQQQGRAYYSVAPVLDVDRYQIDGIDRAMVLGAREIDQDGLNPSDRNWSNLHTVYTHGRGLIAAFANQRGIDNAETSETNAIRWAEGNQAQQDVLSRLDGGYEERIYFGEMSPEYSVVGKPSEDASSVELGLASAGTDAEQMTTYDGEGGVPVGSTFKQLMYAVKFGEPNFILSGRVHGNSEVLYDRTPRERVQKVAPWLTIDGDAYPAIVDGKVVWILDGYTTTDRYPGSELESFRTMTDDSLEQETGLRALPTDEINYMRNSVKATVDAYDGTVRLYEWDEEDPILQAWQAAFPGTVLEQSEISEQLLEHLRYPEDLFKVQRYQLARYHVTDPNDFYQSNDRWQVPEDPNATQFQQPPYRYFVQSPDGDGQVWSMTSVFVPRGRNNLASVLSVNSDATSPEYGRLQMRRLTDQSTAGPGLAFNEISQDQGVRDRLRDYTTGGSPPLMGNLLLMPVADGLAYVEPIYAITAGSATGVPILQYVVVYYDGEVGIGQTLSTALAGLLGVEAPTNPGTDAPPDEGTTDPPPEGGLPIEEQITNALARADQAFADADAALADGDLAAYQQHIEAAQAAVAEAFRLAAQRDGAGDPAEGADGGAGGGGEPTGSASPAAG